MKANSDRELPVFEDPASHQAEAFRLLAARLLHALSSSPRKVALITSPSWFEPRHFVAANLALALAEGEHSTCLIDADLRKPRIHELFSLPLAPGLHQLMLQEAGEEECLYSAPLASLKIIPAGGTSPIPARVLQPSRVQHLLESLAQQSAVSVVVATPVLEASEAAVLSRQAGGTVLVASAYRTTRDALQRAHQTIAEVGGTALGAVLIEGKARLLSWP